MNWRGEKNSLAEFEALEGMASVWKHAAREALGDSSED